MNETNFKPFKCDNGVTYKMPTNHCVFCVHCADIFWDYTNGPYMFCCDVDCDGDFENCNSFREG